MKSNRSEHPLTTGCHAHIWGSSPLLSFSLREVRRSRGSLSRADWEL